MDRKNLLIASGLIGIFIVLLSEGMLIILLSSFNIVDFESSLMAGSMDGDQKPEEFLTYFNNSTPEATAVSVARLNLGKWGFENADIKSVHMTSDGKYWIVEIYTSGYKDESKTITVDAGTWMSKQNDSYEPFIAYDPKDTWRSLDELKALYIAEIQSSTEDVSKPSKITINGKEIWKIPVYDNDSYKLGISKKVEYVYVDAATGKSRNTWNQFNEAAGTDGWLTLKQVDDTLNKIEKEMTGSVGVPFKDALRDLYKQ